MSGSPDRDLLWKYSELVYRRYGIHYSRDKIELLRMKLEKLAFTRNYDLGEYYLRLEAGDPKAADELLRAITVGHTFFFREGEHFQRLAKDIQARRILRPLIWCAASSTGEEPYSIVISLLEHGILDFLVMSTDVNAKALHHMNRGVYDNLKVQDLPYALRDRYFMRIGEERFRIKSELRAYLLIKRLNLHETITFEREFDYVFCRNVMIYFDEDSRKRAVKNLVENLKPQGLLFVGHTEAILTLPSNMERDGAACFRRTA
jgi:chemotaxis protein methyltransferase CheR